MNTIARMFRFEWRYFTHQPSFYIVALIFFTIAFLATSLNQLGMGGGNILKNGPFLIGQIMVILGIFSMFLVVNFVANTAMRDQMTGMAEILYCKPVNPVTYQLGRFLGSFAVVVSVFSVVPFGLLLGSLMPWVTESRIGPFRLSYYLSTFFYLSVPTLFVFSCIFYSLATRLKSMMAVYLAVIAVVIFFEVSDSMFNSPETRAVAALLDPFAARTFAEVTQYWTVFEKNHQLLPFNGSLLINRLIWVGIGLLVMWFFGGFSRSLTLAKIKSAKERFIFAKKDKQTSAESEETFPRTLPYKRFTDKPLLHQDQANTSWLHLIVRTLFEVKQVIFDPAFFILCGFIFFLLVAVMFEPMGMFGSSYLPITLRMVELIRNAMGILSLIIITYYSAEVVWREDTTGMGDIIDSMPVFNLGFWGSKLMAVWLVLVLLLTFSMAVTIIFQLFNQFTGTFPQIAIQLELENSA